MPVAARPVVPLDPELPATGRLGRLGLLLGRRHGAGMVVTCVGVIDPT